MLAVPPAVIAPGGGKSACIADRMLYCLEADFDASAVGLYIDKLEKQIRYLGIFTEFATEYREL